MKKILGIYFSPRKNGNSFLTLKKLKNLLTDKSEIEIININDFAIKECKACYSCLTDSCVLNDDFETIVNKMIESDCIIIVTPVYVLGPNSSFKRFVDRFISLYKTVDKIYKKNVILISIAGFPEVGEGYTDIALKASFEAIGFEIKFSTVLYAALPGEVLYEENIKKIKEVYNSIFSDNSKKLNKCNNCSSTYFELKNDLLKCVICKSEYKLEEGKIVEKKKGQIFFGSLDRLKEHREWLINMKNKYIKKRDELKKLIREETK